MKERRGNDAHRARRERQQPASLPATFSRRTLIATGVCAFAGGAGGAAIVRRLFTEYAPGPGMGVARVPAAAATVPAASPPVLAMEEPLSADTYVPPAPAREPPAVLAAARAGAVPPPRAPHLPPVQAVDVTPAWLRHARPLVPRKGRPQVAVVIDDIGMDHLRSERALALDGNVTLAFLTYAPHLPRWAGSARKGGHEMLVHVPMQPESPRYNPGPNALLTSLSLVEVSRRLRWGLDRFNGYLGANNHMGSLFTEDAAGMGVVMDEMKRRGLLFLDSRTTAKTVCGRLAEARGVPFASRNVFLDDQLTVAGVEHQLGSLEAVARHHGGAIGIGHPHDVTLAVLEKWLPAARSRGIEVVPLSTVLRHFDLSA